MQNSVPILTVRQLGRRLGERWLWRQLSLDLNPGETLGIVGPSGIGKSLFMRSLVCLDPVQEGQISFRGQAVSQWDKTALRRQMLYLAQSPGILDGTVEENLQAVWRLKGQGNGSDRTYSRDGVLGLLKAIGRGEPFLKLSGDRLSGGERQLLGLIRGLQLTPQVLLLDEPTSALDPETTAQVEALLQAWIQDIDPQYTDPKHTNTKQPDPTQRAYLWISHDPQQIERMTASQLDLSSFSP